MILPREMERAVPAKVTHAFTRRLNLDERAQSAESGNCNCTVSVTVFRPRGTANRYRTRTSGMASAPGFTSGECREWRADEREEMHGLRILSQDR